MRIMRLFLTFCAFALLALPAHAAAIDKDGAAKLKVIVDNFVTQQKKITEIDGRTKVEYQGETMVEPAGDYYAVTLPYLRIVHIDGKKVNVGMISINASPGDTPGQWKMRLAVPTPIVTTDAAGNEIARVTIGAQRAAGVWDESLQSFAKLDADYQNIHVAGIDADFDIPETKILYDFSKNAAGKWSGPGSVTMKNLKGTAKTGGTKIAIGSAKIDFAIDQYDSNAILVYRKKLAELSETIAKSTTSTTPPTRNPLVVNAFMDFLTTSGNGMKAKYEISGFKLEKPAAETGPAQTVALPNGAFGFETGGFNTGKAKFALKGGYNGLTITPDTPETSGLTPTDSNIDIVLENLPLKEIMELARNTMAAAGSPDMRQIAGLQLMLKLPALLSQSGTFMTVTNTNMQNKDVGIVLDGRARADVTAVNSATVNSKATFRGLDILISRLRERAKNPSVKEPQKLLQTINQLESVKQYARVEKTPSGETLHIIEFVMDEKGQMLLNGQDARKAKAAKTGVAKPAPVPAVTPGQKLP